MTQKKVELSGKFYVWNGRQWYDERTHVTPPLVILTKLNKMLQREELTVTNPRVLLDQAVSARQVGDLDRSERLARRILTLVPGHRPAIAMLSAILRQRLQPEQALVVTEAYRTTNPAISTSRAAALCDLSRWAEAKTEIGWVLAQGESGEALNVVMRIKAARPDLYQ